MAKIDPKKQFQLFVAKHGSKTKAAAALGISRPYVHEMVKGSRPVSDAVLAKLGLERVVTIRKVKVA